MVVPQEHGFIAEGSPHELTYYLDRNKICIKRGEKDTNHVFDALEAEINLSWDAKNPELVELFEQMHMLEKNSLTLKDESLPRDNRTANFAEFLMESKKAISRTVNQKNVLVLRVLVHLLGQQKSFIH